MYPFDMYKKVWLRRFYTLLHLRTSKCFYSSLSIILFVIGLLYLAFIETFPTYSIRYRLTVKLMTPAGIREESAVLGFDYPMMPELFIYTSNFHLHGVMRSAAMRIPVRGDDAIYIIDARPIIRDEQYGQPLFPHALSLSLLPFHVFPHHDNSARREQETTADIIRDINRQRSSQIIPVDLLPMVVHFTNQNDMSTMEEVDPNNLTKTIVPEFAIIETRLQISPGGELDRVTDQWPSWIERKDLHLISVRVNGQQVLAQVPIKAMRGE